MSRTIDERVVSMQFDNKQFESNIQTSLGTIDKLKRSLNFKDSSKSLSNLDAAVKKVDMSSLGNAAHTVGLKFSAMYSIADQAFRNITTSAMNAGKKIVSAFTTDPIKTGLQEYETQINAVQTILANTQSKGTTLDNVNSALDELNTYADKTIYNFTEMTRNIGTFTAAGVDLDKSVTSIKGIANLAAVSGSTSQQASTAMYQLSQALAAGKVQLMDWNSVVNAGMGGQVFQDALKRTAKQMGYNVDEMIKKYGSFRESLTQGEWLTAEVLTETLTQLSGAYSEADLIAQGYSKEQAKEITELAETAVNAATKVKTFTQLMDTLKEAAQSGWTQTWELLVGDFEEAKELWTSVSDIFGGFINSTSEARNKLLEGAMTSNWDKLITKINDAGIETSVFEDKVKAVMKDHGINVDEVIKKHGSLEEAFRSDAVSSDILKKAVEGLEGSLVDLSTVKKELSKGDTGEDVEKIQQALKNLDYDIGETGVDGIFGKNTEAAVKAFQEAQGLKITGIIDDETLAALEKAGGHVDNLTESVGGLIDGITELGGRELLIESLKNIFEGLMSVLKPIKNAFRNVFPPATSEQLYSLIEKFHEFTSGLKLNMEQTRKVYQTFKGLFSVIDIGWTFVKKLAGGIVSLFSNFSGLGNGILDVTSSWGEWLSDLRDSVKESDIFGKAVEKIVGFLKPLADGLKKVGSFIKDRIKMPGFEGFLKLMQGIWNIITKVGSVISKIGSSIGDFLANAFSSGDISAGLDILNGGLIAGLLLKFKDVIGEGWAGLFGGLDETFGGVKDILDSVRGSLETWQASLKSGILLKIGIAIGILAAAILILSGIDSAKLAASLGAITVLFADLMGSMALFSEFSSDLKGMATVAIGMIGMSIAILILASALKKLSDLSWEGIGKGLVGVLGLTAVVVAASYLFSKMDETVIKGVTSMVIFAAAIKVLASACKDLSSLSWEELAKGLVGISSLLVAFGIFSKILSGSSSLKALTKDGIFSSKSQKNMISAGIAMIGIAVAMKIFASAMSDFAELSWTDIGKGSAAIAGLLLVVAGFDLLAGRANKLITTAASLVIVGASMKIFASAMSDFAELSWTDIGKGSAAIAGLLLAIAAFIKIASSSTSIFSSTGNSIFSASTSTNLISTGIALIAVSASLKILASVMEDLGSLSWNEIIKSIVAIGASMFILSKGLMSMTGTLPGSAALLVAALSLSILAPVMKTLGSLSWMSIVKGLVSIAGAFAVIGVAGLLIGPLSPIIIALAGAFALIGIAVLAVGVGLAAAAAGLTALALAGTAGATAIVASLTIIVTGIAGLIPAVAAKIGEAIVVFCQVIGDSAEAICEAVKKVILSLVPMLVECVPVIADGALKLIVGILEALATHTPKIIEYLFDFLISLIDGLAERMPELIQSAVNLIMQFFSGIVDALSGIDVDTILKGIVGIGLMAGLMAVLGFVGGLTVPAMMGVLGMGAVIAELAIVIAAIGALAQIPGFEWLIGEGAELIKKIGNALGGFVGGIIGGVAEGITASLPQIGTDLSNFMTNLKPFIDGANTIDETTLSGVKSIADIIMTLTKANILEGLTAWLTGGSSLTNFGEQLVPFGTAMKNFSAEVTGINEEAVTAAANAGMILAKMADTIPNAGGVAAFFAGENDMATFGTQLVSFGTAMKKFSAEVTGIDEEAVTAAANAGMLLSEMANAIPNAGGVAAFFAGENDMTTFGTQLVAFGTAMKNFSTEVSGINEEAVTAAANAGMLMTEMSNSIPNFGGVAAFFAGDNDMATFGSQLVAFGIAIKSFSTEVSGINEEAVTAAANAGTMMAEMADTIPNSGGLISWFSGDNDMATFGAQLVLFGTAMKDFSNEVSGIDEGAVTAAATAGSSLADMAKNLPESGGLWSVFSADNDLSTFAKEIKKFGEGMKDFSDEVADVDESAITSSATAASSLVDMANNLPSEDNIENLKNFGGKLKTFGGKMKEFYDEVKDIDISQFATTISEISKLGSVDVSGLSTLGESLSQIGKSSVESFINAFTESTSRILSTGTLMVTSLMQGISSSTSKLIVLCNVMGMQAATAASTSYSSFHSAGKYVAQGFANGISANTFMAVAKAKAMAQKAYQAAKSALNINSPSKLFRSLGYSVPEGFALGIDKLGGMVKDSAVGMADTAIEGTKSAIARIADAVNSDIDAQPTIRPVIDLSEVTAGASAINGMLGMKPSVGVLANVNAISASMSSRQNGVNKDVVSAIDNLGRKLGKTAGDTYNINGVTYDDGSNITDAVKTLVRAARVERRS